MAAPVNSTRKATARSTAFRTFGSLAPAKSKAWSREVEGVVPLGIAEQLVDHTVALELLAHPQRLFEGNVAVGLAVQEQRGGIARRHVAQRLERLEPVAQGRQLAQPSSQQPIGSPGSEEMDSSDQGLDSITISPIGSTYSTLETAFRSTPERASLENTIWPKPTEPKPARETLINNRRTASRRIMLHSSLMRPSGAFVHPTLEPVSPSE